MSGMTRRRFLKTGAGGIIIAGIPGVLRIIQPAASAALREDIVNLKEYYNHFGVDEKIILDVMQTALDRGGDYCDVYFQHRIANWVGLEDKAVNKAYTNIDFGVGIRVISGDQTGYSFTEEITPRSI